MKWRELDLDALEHNYRVIRRRVGGAKHIIASVKANAYGHGVVPVVRALDRLGVYSVATASLDDARAIRAAGLGTPILMLACMAPETADHLLALDVVPTVHNHAMAEAISGAATERVEVYVKLDSGLGRLGVPVAEGVDFVQDIARLPNLVIEGLYTHLPFTDASGRDWAREGLARFDCLLADVARRGLHVPVTQAISSAGIAVGLADTCTAVCPGHLLYGGFLPLAPDLADLTEYRPVLRSIKCRLIDIGLRPAGGRMGVNGALVLPSSLVVGVVPFGIADGYRRPVGGRSAVMWLRGRRVPVLGISLEYTLLDLTGLDEAKIGEEVVVLGESGNGGITASELAGWQGGSVLETLTSLDKPMPCLVHASGGKSCA
jgi:alanine racemase